MEGWQWIAPLAGFVFALAAVATGVILAQVLRRRRARRGTSGMSPAYRPGSIPQPVRQVEQLHRGAGVVGTPGPEKLPRDGLTGMIRTTDVQVTVSADGLTVKTLGVGARPSQEKVYCTVRWREVERLYLDTGAHDSVVALYASRPGAPRRHVIDAKALSRRQWATLAELISEKSARSLYLDLTGLDRSRPFEAF